jgi:serine phosphatase RsbU (regulator of sigma subunit)
MEITKRLVAAERALRSAAPDRLPQAVREVLCGQYAATAVEFRLADYALTVLQPVDGAADGPARSLPVHASAAGRAFGAQEPYVEELDGGPVRVHLPVTVRGDRLGVLSVTLPTAPAEAELAELAEVAQVLGHEVVVAERDTDVYQRARRADRLTLAAEMQWQLLRARSSARPEYAVGAQLEPAYAIFGDSFDWSASADRLTLYLANGMGEDVEASLLTNLGVNALRNARRADVPLADQAALADQAIHARYGGEAYLSALLVDVELPTGRMRVVDAGSPKMLRLRDRTVATVDFEPQLPLGMFEETDYVAQDFALEPGDRLVFVSDGVCAAAAPEGGDQPGERALARAVTSTSLLPAAEAPAAVLRELGGTPGGLEPDDDALVVCLDWFGKPPATSSGAP